jgi:HK97 family phage portal protein
MNLFSPILRLFNSGTLSNPERGYQVGATENIGTSAGISVSDERALKVSSVWACVQLISNSVASLPLGFYRRTDMGREELDRNHPLRALMERQPNRWMKPRDFRLAMTTQMCLWHNAYAEIVWNNDRPVALMPLRPGRTAPFITDDGELTYHYQTEEGVKIYAQRSILHLKGFGTDGIVGAERNNFARETLGLSVAAEVFAAKQFANGGRPGGTINFDAFLTPEQRKQVKELYEGLSEGPTNANRLWVLEGGSKYEALDFTADQMQMIATRSMQLGEIARFFGVPDVMIGAGSGNSSAWPASFEQQLLYFLNFTLQGYIDEWECAIAQSLVPRAYKSEIYADHDVSSFIKMDSSTKASYLSTLVQNGLATRNEARRMLNLPSVEGGDDLTVQVNLTNVENLEEIGNADQDAGTGALRPEIRQ